MHVDVPLYSLRTGLETGDTPLKGRKINRRRSHLRETDVFQGGRGRQGLPRSPEVTCAVWYVSTAHVSDRSALTGPCGPVSGAGAHCHDPTDECRRVPTSADECRRVPTSADECRRVPTSAPGFLIGPRRLDASNPGLADTPENNVIDVIEAPPPSPASARYRIPGWSSHA